MFPAAAADVVAAAAGSATAETMAQMRGHFGLDQPMVRQLISYVDHRAMTEADLVLGLIDPAAIRADGTGP